MGVADELPVGCGLQRVAERPALAQDRVESEVAARAEVDRLLEVRARRRRGEDDDGGLGQTRNRLPPTTAFVLADKDDGRKARVRRVAARRTRVERRRQCCRLGDGEAPHLATNATVAVHDLRVAIGSAAAKRSLGKPNARASALRLRLRYNPRIITRDRVSCEQPPHSGKLDCGKGGGPQWRCRSAKAGTIAGGERPRRGAASSDQRPVG